MTAFQKRVYDLVSRIPRGSVTTYRLTGQALSCGSFRAIGQALRHNPFAPMVPCHRVISSDLSPGGFQGELSGPAVRRKLLLLAKEGVLFNNNRLADTSRLWKPPCQ